LITGSRLLINDEPVAVEATSRLVRPFNAVFVGPSSDDVTTILAGMTRRDDMVVRHVADPGHPFVSTADLVVLLFAATDPDPVTSVTDLVAVLKAAEAGPFAIEALVTGAPPALCQQVVSALLASPAGQTVIPTVAVATRANVDTLNAFATNLADVRGVAFRATSGLRVVQLAMKDASSSAGRTELLDRIDALQQELPLLVELELLREIVSGRAALPRWLRSELARLLIHPEPARRLGLEPDADAATLQDAIQMTSTNWRVLENTGRIPFSARKAMLIAQQALDRLHAELAYYG
ncbi:MAG: hypothetical protein ABIW84_09485, partial [Ilumatobacteraceae bacterium]